MLIMFSFRQPGRLLRRARAALAVTGLVLSLPGCATVTGSPNLSQVRVIDASPDAGGLDIYQGNGILAYNLGLGTITSYVPLSPGNYSIQVDAAGTRQQLAVAGGTFATNAQYTVLVGDFSTGLSEVILKDQTTAAPTGQIALRVLDQSSRGGTVDLYLVASGSTIATAKPILTSVSFGENTGYFNVPAGTYTLIAVPTGTVPTTAAGTTYTGASVTYGAGSAKTIVLIDQQLATTPGLQVIIANDFDPASATN
jgi:hypothetical protein